MVAPAGYWYWYCVLCTQYRTVVPDSTHFVDIYRNGSGLGLGLGLGIRVRVRVRVGIRVRVRVRVRVRAANRG